MYNIGVGVLCHSEYKQLEAFANRTESCLSHW